MSRIRARAAALVAALGLTLALPAGAAALTDFTWTGGGAFPSQPGWSNGVNWSGGSAPAGSVGTLTFPALSRPECAAQPPAQICFSGYDDIAGLSANALSLDDSAPYSLSGNQALTVGAGGITAAPGSAGTVHSFNITFPLALGAPQTWSVAGGAGQLSMHGPVTGAGQALSLALSGPANSLPLVLDGGDVEVGAVHVTGGASLLLGSPIRAGSLNGTDGAPVTFDGPVLAVDGRSAIGALTLNTARAQVGHGHAPDATLSIKGGLTLSSHARLTLFVDQAGQAPGTDFSQVSATGPVDLGGATLDLEPGGGGLCPALHGGDEDQIVTTTGTISGRFAGLPDKAVVTTQCGFSGDGPRFRIGYTTHAVTATVLGTTTTTVTADPPRPFTNEPVTLTAHVTTSTGHPAGTLHFADDCATIVNGICRSAPLPGCTSLPGHALASGFGAICRASFVADSAPGIVVTYTPADSEQAASESQPLELHVRKDAPLVRLRISNVHPSLFEPVRLTAVLTPRHRGRAKPHGFVDFRADGKEIPNCFAEPKVRGDSTVAGCRTELPRGRHVITARYQTTDGNFAGTLSAPRKVAVGGLLSGVLVPAGPSAAIGALLRRGGFTFTFWPPPARATLVIAWRTARTGGTVVATARQTVATVHSVKVRVRLTSAGRRLLRGAPGIRLFTRASLTLFTGQRASARAAFTLRR